MAKRGKKYKKMIEEFEDKLYPLDEAIKVTKKTSYSSFPGSIELHFAINLPKDKEAKSIKGAIALPHPIASSESRVVVFCEKDQADAAKKAGAVEAGLDDLVKKIQGGWMEFDVALATPAVMGQIAVLGKQLGPKGLMPNPKTGTLVDDISKIADAIAEFQKGKTKFTCDESGVIHLAVGKVDTDDAEIAENIKAALDAVAEAVGKQLDTLTKTISLSATMGAGVRVEPGSVVEKATPEEE